MSYEDQFAAIQQLLLRSDQDPRQVVVMMCGVAGSGKTTLAKKIIATYPSFERLSIDELVAEKHGLWQVDYDPEKYSVYQDEADEELQRRLMKLLNDGKRDVVLDRSFWNRETRDDFRKLLSHHDVRIVLLYLQPPGKEFIRQRIDHRREQGRNANSALDIDDELLDSFLAGFEPPQGEGEVVIQVQ